MIGTWWIVIGVDGTTTEHPEQPTYADLSAAVGGPLEAVTLHSPGTKAHCTMYVNEEGKLEGLPINIRASRFAHTGGHWHRDVIVGPAVLIGPPDKDGNDTPLLLDTVEEV